MSASVEWLQTRNLCSQTEKGINMAPKPPPKMTPKQLNSGRPDTCCRRCVDRSAPHIAIIQAVFVRVLLLCHASFSVFVVVELNHDPRFYLLMLTNLLIIVEGIWRIWKKGGREPRWFSPCLFSYLCVVVPPVWLIELHRVESYEKGSPKYHDLKSRIPSIGLSETLFANAFEQTLLLVLIISRWALPRGATSRDQLSALLFLFLAIGSDIMSVFELFNEREVRNDPQLTYATLFIWSFSLLQLCFVLTGRKTGIMVEPKKFAKLSRRQQLCEVCFSQEVKMLLCGIFAQDIPFATVRIYTLLVHNLRSYSVVYFICKNLVIITLVIYRIVVVFASKLGAFLG